MKVSTDSVLLGALCDCKNSSTILDIGTGCGILALMMAQKTTAQITAIDIDIPSVEEANRNFSHSPWSNRLRAINQSLVEFTSTSTDFFDLIITNPPYFDESIYSPTLQRNFARNNQSLSFETIAECTNKLLSEKGELWIILPPQQHQKFAFAATPLLLYCNKRIEISHNECDSPSLIVSQWRRNSQTTIQTIEQISIFNHQKQYSDKFKLITKDFYPFF